MWVCLCVRTVKGKRLELSTSNLVDLAVHGSRSACIDPEVKRWKVTELSNALPSQVGMTIWLFMVLVWLNMNSRLAGKNGRGMTNFVCSGTFSWVRVSPWHDVMVKWVWFVATSEWNCYKLWLVITGCPTLPRWSLSSVLSLGLYSHHCYCYSCYYMSLTDILIFTLIFVSQVKDITTIFIRGLHHRP